MSDIGGVNFLIDGKLRFGRLADIPYFSVTAAFRGTKEGRQSVEVIFSRIGNEEVMGGRLGMGWRNAGSQPSENISSEE